MDFAPATGMPERTSRFIHRSPSLGPGRRLPVCVALGGPFGRRGQIVRPILMLVQVAILGAVTLNVAKAQDTNNEDDEELRAGLVAVYGRHGHPRLERVDRSLSFDTSTWPPVARIGAGPIEATWRGLLKSQSQGTYQLHAYLVGQVRIQLAGKTVLESQSDEPAWKSSPPIELSFDWHPLEIQYRSSAPQSRLALFWSGPGFQREPLGARQLFHEPRHTPAADLARGEFLTRLLRCVACHEVPGHQLLPAPALDQLAGNLREDWLTEWLTAKHATDSDISDKQRPDKQGPDLTRRRMPHFELDAQQAAAITAFLLQSPPMPQAPAKPVDEPAAQATPTRSKTAAKKPKTAKTAKSPQSPPIDPLQGERLLVTVGCLACHQLDELGSATELSGGELSRIADKRTADFFGRMLERPDAVNRHHRMPHFELTAEQRANLAAYLATRTTDRQQDVRTENAPQAAKIPAEDDIEQSKIAGASSSRGVSSELIATGARLFREYRCHACHAGPADEARTPVPRRPIGRTPAEAPASENGGCWNTGTAGTSPRYDLRPEDRRALESYWSEIGRVRDGAVVSSMSDSDWLVREKNCLACHARGESPGVAAGLSKVGQRIPDLAALIPAMTPPPLDSVGDKLLDSALGEAISRRQPARRPWLLVQMPRFRLEDKQLHSLVNHFVTEDRIPDYGRELAPETDPGAALTAGARLVTTDGFGCTSCHQVGSVEPPQAPLNAKGPNLSGLGARIRPAWFDRWVRNPARIVPRMEMPSVQLAVRGVLDDNLDRQLSLVWHVLNEPGFEPPLPNPVRVVRQNGVDLGGRASVITDVVETSQGPLVKPLLIGLPNRHNVLYDLESARLTHWNIGDVARQRTKGKSWFWELAGAPVRQPSHASPGDMWQLRDGGPSQEGRQAWQPRRSGQFATEFDEYRHVPGGVAFRHRLRFEPSADAPIVVTVEQTILAARDEPRRGFDWLGQVKGMRPGQILRMPLLPLSPEAEGNEADRPRVEDNGRRLRLPGVAGVEIRVADGSEARIDKDGMLRMVAGSNGTARFELQLRTTLPVDQYPALPVQEAEVSPLRLDVVPGFEAQRLPLTEEIMPTAFGWRPDGTMVFTSLKGRVWLARDRDHDGLEETLQCFSDDLATPFGVAAGDGYLDVINKYALLRLHDDDGDDRADRVETLASGWGHTADYHDWAVGLPGDGEGGYYIGTACQQDKRSLEAAHWRGRVLRLIPRSPTDDDPRLFAVQEVSGGHRFPIGIARRRNGDLFVTDNQGNYNPFNELNHVQPGARYGFLNTVERRPDFQPPLTAPAVNIPHPWTRSVNGICFLETPKFQEISSEPAASGDAGGAAASSVFGPFEGHLIGCEYDTRRLIRMSLQRVGDQIQGAAYPFSFDEPPTGEPLRGPLACAVSPTGDLYVGCIRDSGWGGANNVGSIVRLRPDLAKLPTGLAEVSATPDGFRLRFTRPVDAPRAADPGSYSLSSYTRESTPAYGGPDQNRRAEKVRRVTLSDDRLQVNLVLDELRAGYVYELQLKNLAESGASFFPSEAYYSLNRIP